MTSSPNIIRNLKLKRLRWAEHVARMEESRIAYRDLVGRPEREREREREGRSLGRPRSRWEDSVNINFREVGCGASNWIQLAQGRSEWRAYVRALMNVLVH